MCVTYIYIYIYIYMCVYIYVYIQLFLCIHGCYILKYGELRTRLKHPQILESLHQSPTDARDSCMEQVFSTLASLIYLLITLCCFALPAKIMTELCLILKPTTPLHSTDCYLCKALLLQLSSLFSTGLFLSVYKYCILH